MERYNVYTEQNLVFEKYLYHKNIVNNLRNNTR